MVKGLRAVRRRAGSKQQLLLPAYGNSQHLFLVSMYFICYNKSYIF
ncbi:hypothetical protein CLOSTHATH_02017 [Hungatella hathewayi DSM 13479]|uniref:Uncharacterized protein n=1 Tax=Hungatella hathewayi DSM 13479 TaxID=566550 RepID=D3AEI3_9FIRM|nr:hypothetical protein CLOSTHATH_02017 [Hungatella hathewayi DSM 13479]